MGRVQGLRQEWGEYRARSRVGENIGFETGVGRVQASVQGLGEHRV